MSNVILFVLGQIGLKLSELHRMEYVTLLEACVIISNKIENYDRQVEFIKVIIHSRFLVGSAYVFTSDL